MQFNAMQCNGMLCYVVLCYVCMYVCVRVIIYIYIHIHIHIRIHIHIHIYIYIYLFIYIYILINYIIYVFSTDFLGKTGLLVFCVSADLRLDFDPDATSSTDGASSARHCRRRHQPRQRPKDGTHRDRPRLGEPHPHRAQKATAATSARMCWWFWRTDPYFQLFPGVQLFYLFEGLKTSKNDMFVPSIPTSRIRCSLKGVISRWKPSWHPDVTLAYPASKHTHSQNIYVYIT